ncbi:fused MFS/spermidine synthase [Egicoccus sp. AB-alg2]|uniref:fused MFS/spermidine synthase n=1 Tax=Egicoccus sp. AB-alg2 TaxID=3242693 RepID=UPI00359D3462
MSRDGRATATPPTWGGAPLLLLLLFCSGFAALVYQVLWARQLGLLLGSTAQAAALTVAIFFAGLALGGLVWGRRAARQRSPLVGFGRLEVGVALTALGHFVLLDVYAALYPRLYALVGADPTLDLAAKLLVATVVLLPPSFLMGGTLPLMVQHVVRAPDRLGVLGSRLYGVNTAGSATGALAAGFVLPLYLGFDRAYLLAVGIDLTVGVAAIALARTARVADEVPAAPAPAPPRPVGASPEVSVPEGAPVTGTAVGSTAPARFPLAVTAVAFVSGFATLAVEIVWTRLFAQVLQNSAYTYALVLATFLAALALGAAVANGLARLRRVSPRTVLAALLVASAVVTATSPWLFHTATDGLAYVGADLGWAGYLAAVAVLAAVVMLGPGTVLGVTLPYLLRAVEGRGDAPGALVGRLVAVNTVGSIVGSLAAGFVLLPLVGAWASLVIVAGGYVLLLAALAVRPRIGWRPAAAGLAAAAVTGALVVAVPRDFDTLSVRPARTERVLEVREGPQATVAVVETGSGSRAIRVNNYYTLGSSGARHAERDQTLIPLLAHPEADSVFYLGMGTGITAGAALDLPVERVVVCELLAEVVDAARDHFTRWVNGLFEDERVEVHAEDGRNCLRRSQERYDLVVSDLFTPWKAGTGNLYTREHYATARDRLTPGGAYVQWMPLYQVSDAELGSVARTMGEVFDRVVVWRGDFFAQRSVIALVGHTDDAPLDLDASVAAGRRLAPDASAAELEALVLRLYAGNATSAGVFADAPVNTDARPVVEYTAPRTHREARVGRAEFLVGDARERLYDALLAGAPPAADPYLAGLTDAQLAEVAAGRAWSAHVWAQDAGRREAAARAGERFRGASDVAGTPTTPARRFDPDR